MWLVYICIHTGCLWNKRHHFRGILFSHNRKHLCKYRSLDAPSLNYTQFYFLKWTIKNKAWTCPNLKYLFLNGWFQNYKRLFWWQIVIKVLSLVLLLSHSALHIPLWILTQAQRLSIVPVLSHSVLHTAFWILTQAEMFIFVLVLWHSTLHISLLILTQAPELQVVYFKLTHIHPVPSAVVLEHQCLPQHKHYLQDGPILKKIQHMYSKYFYGPRNCLSWSTHHSSYMSCRNVLTAMLK